LRADLAGPLLLAGPLALAGCGGGSSASDPKRQDAAAKADAREIVTRLETCFTDSQSYAPCANAHSLTGTSFGPGPALGSGPGQATVAAGAQTYTITAHSRSGNTFVLAKDSSGRVTRSCASRTAGGCLGGAW
jgi:hypothetical protein